MDSITYKVVIRHLPDGRFGVTVPALPGCVTWGQTYDEAVAMAQDAITGYLEVLKKHHRPIPLEKLSPRVSLGIRVTLPTAA